MDTFTKSAPPGSFAAPSDSQVVYTGDHGMGWVEYGDGWPSTYTNGMEGYQPSTVQSVHDGVLDFYLHNDPSGNPVGANPSPLPGGNRYQRYGVWSFCERIAPGDSHNLDDFYQAPLLWPQSDGEGPSTPHYGGSGAQDHSDIKPVEPRFDPTQWHVYTQEWGPAFRSYYVDGRLVGTSTNQVWSNLERWQLQVEPSGINDGGSGHVYVNWVWIGTPSNSTGSGGSGGSPPPPRPPSPPSNTALPSIMGTPQQGSTLTASTGSWNNSPTGYAYRWQDCTATQCADIGGATGSTYTLQSSDVGSEVDVVVTATNGGGSSSATSSQIGPVTSSSSGGSGGTGGTGGSGGTATIQHVAWVVRENIAELRLPD